MSPPYSNALAYRKPVPRLVPKLPKPRERKMTFILGLNCVEGLVMCSDSLEDDGFNKRIVGKISSFTAQGHWGLMWGGAGHGGLIDRFTGELQDSFMHGVHYEELDEEIDTALAEIGEKQTTADSYCQFVFGAWRKGRSDGTQIIRGEHGLLRGDRGGCVTPVQGDFACAGMDITLANFILETLHDFFMPLEEVIRLAFFVTALMKRHAVGVDGPTTVQYYRDGGDGIAGVMPQQAAQIEKTLDIDNFYEAILSHWMTLVSDIERKTPARITQHRHVRRRMGK